MKIIQIMHDHKVPKADGSIGKYHKVLFPNDVAARKQLESRDEELIEERYDGDAASDERRVVDISHDHSQRLEEAVLLKKEDKMIAAAELLDGIDPNYFEPVHHIIVKEARVLRGVLRDCSSNPNHDEGWTKRVEKHGKYHFSLETKLKRYNCSDVCTDTYDILTFRVVTPIESSMLVPVLSVLNECELYCSWAPRLKVPRLGVSKSEKLLQLERCSQITLLEVDHPWPIGKREMMVKTIACDDVSTASSKIVASFQTMDVENNGEYGLNILPARNGERVKLNGGMLIEKLPLEHPLRQKCMSTEEDLALFTFAISFKITKNLIVPINLINFALKFFFPKAFEKIFHVGEEVRDGLKPAHRDIIQRKREELYDYLYERVNSMFCEKRVIRSPVSLGVGTFSNTGVALDNKV